MELYLQDSGVEFQKNIDLKKKTWIHRGGKCEFYILPNSRDQLLEVISYLYREDIEFVILGHTSNTYILNSCNIPVVVSTVKCRGFKVMGDRVYCEAGVGVIRLANQMVRNGINGYEYLTDLPGTVGAAIYNNSSCKLNSISSLVISVEVLNKDGNVVIYKRDELSFKYRSSAFKEGLIDGVILSVILKADIGDRELLMQIAENTKKERRMLLENRSKTLGSTVNQCFCLGRMPLCFYLPFKAYNLLQKIVDPDPISRQHKSKVFLCTIAGYRQISKYISDQDVIIYNWLDEGADAAFPLYLEFMRRVYRTDRIEIEILK